MTNPVIVVSGVSKDFKLPHEKIDSIKGLFVNPFQVKKNKGVETQHALKDISFEVKEGEFFGIVGRNGSGKSTLLKLIAKIYQPTEGRIDVAGRLVPFIELGVGFNPELTGRENTYLNGALMGFSDREIDAKYQDIVEFAELERFMDQKLKNYSSGMQVRLAFSVATILANSDILLIDEVLAVGDASFQRKCFSYFRQLKKQKKTVVFVSHDMEAVREYCDRCVLIDKAELVYEGSPEVAAEKYVKLFNDSAQPLQKRNDERWGDGAAHFEKVVAGLKNDTIVVEQVVSFKQSLNEPIVGFNIKNSSGQVLCGTNSKVIKKKLGECQQGDVLKLVWTLPNIFGDDTFIVESAVTHRDGVIQADWWHESADFTVRNDTSTPHPVSPKVQLTVSDH